MSWLEQWCTLGDAQIFFQKYMQWIVVQYLLEYTKAFIVHKVVSSNANVYLKVEGSVKQSVSAAIQSVMPEF